MVNGDVGRGWGKRVLGRQEEQHIPDLLFHPAQMIL